MTGAVLRGNMSEENPWKRVSSKVIYTNPWLKLREDQVIRPDGKPGIYGVVETRIATGVVAITGELEVYLVGQYRYPTEQYSWEIIEGGTDDNEDPLDAIKRELREEAGLIANSWAQLGPDAHLSNCISSEVAKFYVAWDLIETESDPEGTEVLQVKRLPYRECIRMAEKGEIKDAMSIIALSRLSSWLQENGFLD